MSVPITAGLVYFTVARAHAALAENALANHYRYFVNPVPGNQLVVGVIALSLPEGSRLDDALADSSFGAGCVHNIFAASKLLAPAMAATTVVYWLIPLAQVQEMRHDAERLQLELELDRQGRLFEAECVWSDQYGAGQITRQLCVDALAHASFSNAQ